MRACSLVELLEKFWFRAFRGESARTAENEEETLSLGGIAGQSCSGNGGEKLRGGNLGLVAVASREFGREDSPGWAGRYVDPLLVALLSSNM